MESKENPLAQRIPLKIAIVEDEAIIARDMKQLLEEAGHVVVRMFMVGEEAARKIPLLDVDLVLMDVFLRGSLNGIDVAELLMLYQNVPIVFVTGHTDPAIMKRITYTGSYGLVIKPFSTTSFLTTIDIAYNNFIHQKKDHEDHSKSGSGEKTAENSASGASPYTKEQRNSIRSMVNYADYILNNYDELSNEDIRRFAVKVSVCLKMFYTD